MPSSNSPSSLRVTLFYSYSHKDIQYKNEVEKTLATLKERGFLRDWSDSHIVPGQVISATLRSKLSECDIIAFLLSPDFLDSAECRKEWNDAKTMADSGHLVFRVPIIVRPCAWKDFLGNDDVKALPWDGKPVSDYQNADAAWQEVYEGIKSVIVRLRATFTPKPAFLRHLNIADIPASQPLTIDDIFVFPRLIQRDLTFGPDRIREHAISSVDQLRRCGHSIVHGQDKSGKTSLAKHLTRSLIDASKPVLFADLSTATGPLGRKFLQRAYEDTFNGDYSLWRQQNEKTLILDNMTDAPHLLKFLTRCAEVFQHIYLFVSSDIFHSFLIDEPRLGQFTQIRLEPLTLTQQEQLIRKRLTFIDNGDFLTDGYIDQAEDRVNSIIISNRIVPRYPFFILSILQTYDTSMPTKAPITSYGHCYYVFIIASLQRAGISEADEAINSCFNFAEQLALATFQARASSSRSLDFSTFQNTYRSQYFIETSVLSRLTHKDYGIISNNGEFKTAYMYYFFLGRVLATNSALAKEYVPELCDHSDIEANYLTLLFAIHHAIDDAIIEDIMIRTMVDLEDITPATLREDETSRFVGVVSDLPESVLTSKPVEEERAREREATHDLDGGEDEEPVTPYDRQNDRIPNRTLRVLKSNRILGQVLRTQYGKLPKSQIEDIVEAIADSSLRLVNQALGSQEEIGRFARHIHARKPSADLAEVRRLVTFLSFLWTIGNIEHAVHAVNVPSIREAVERVVTRNDNPAYDIFGYFYQLDSGEELTVEGRDRLAELYMCHRDQFVKRVLSIRTQVYMNTHRSRTSIEQSICSVLGIKYVPRLKVP